MSTLMSFSYALRSARAQEIVDAIDAGGTAGYMKFYDTAKPTTVGEVPVGSNVLGKAWFSYPCGTVVSGELTFSAFSGELVYLSGEVNHAKFFASDDTHVMDLKATDVNEGGPIEMDSKNVYAGHPITFVVVDNKITEGNT